MSTLDVVVHQIHIIVRYLLDLWGIVQSFLLLKFPHGNLCMTAGNAINVATKLYSMNKDKPLFWAHSLLLQFVTGFGGGFLAPMLIGRPSMPVANDNILPCCIAAWYVTHSLGLNDILTSTPAKIIWLPLLGILYAQ